MKKDQTSIRSSFKALLSVSAMVLFFSHITHAEMGESFVLCKNKKMVRTLRVELGQDQKCRAIYTKQGVDEVIGSSQQVASCVEFVTNVRKNLEEGQWNCREVKEARTSSVLTGSE